MKKHATTVALRILIYALAFMIATLGSVAAAGANLTIFQMVQDEGTFKMYISLLDDDGRSTSANASPAAFALQSGGTGVLQPDKVIPFSQSGEGINYIAAVDISGSITSEESKAIKESLTDLVRQMGQNDYMRLYTIGTDVTNVTDYTNDTGALKDAIERSIHRKDKKTQLFQGISEALQSVNVQMVGGPTRTVIILFTDGGDDSAGGWTPDDVLKRMDSLDAKIPIYAVGVKGNDKSVSPASVSKLCADSGGHLYTANKASEISSAVSSISQALEGSLILEFSPEDPGFFGVNDADWTLTTLSGNRTISNSITVSTSPTPPPERKEMPFVDKGMKNAVLAALNKDQGDTVYEDEADAVARIKTLAANDMGILELDDMEKMPDIETLSLKNNRFEKLDALKNLEKLTSLDLEGNHIENISVLKFLDELQTLNLNDNNISSIDTLRGLGNLTYLNLDDNRINSVQALGKMELLETLCLSGNDITDLTPLAGLSALKTLDLSRNGIKDVSPLAELKELTSLSLSGNNLIEDMAVLYDLSQAGCETDVEIPVPTPEPVAQNPEPTPEPEPDISEKITLWLRANWLYLLIGFAVVLAAIAVIAMRVSKKNAKKREEAGGMDPDIADLYDSVDIDETIPMGAHISNDPDATIPLDAGITRIRFMVEYEGKAKERTLPIRRELSIGRKDCDLLLDDMSVSRRHALISLKFDRLYIQDLGSSAGTKLNGTAIAGETPLKLGDSVTVGKTTLKISAIS